MKPLKTIGSYICQETCFRPGVLSIWFIVFIYHAVHPHITTARLEKRGEKFLQENIFYICIQRLPVIYVIYLCYQSIHQSSIPPSTYPTHIIRVGRLLESWIMNDNVINHKRASWTPRPRFAKLCHLPFYRPVLKRSWNPTLSFSYQGHLPVSSQKFKGASHFHFVTLPWKQLPTWLREAGATSAFKIKPKTFLFSKLYS